MARINDVKGAPFRYRGVFDVSNCKTSADVMSAAGLDWTTDKCQLYANLNGELKECPGAFSTYRTDTDKPLGLVKSKYTIVQNKDAFKFFDDAIGKNKAIWQTAGSFNGGARIFVSAKLPKNIFVKGDPVENYLVFTNTHDGSSGVKILFTPIRVICQNTLNAAIRSSTNYISLRHTSGVFNKLSVADEILGICNTQIDSLNEVYNAMQETKVTDEDAVQVFGNVVLTDKDLVNIKDTGHTIRQIVMRNNDAINDAGLSMRKVNQLSEMYQYYFGGTGQREQVGNAWGVYNAVSGYYCNVDGAEGSTRMQSILFGDKAKKIETAGNIIVGA